MVEAEMIEEDGLEQKLPEGSKADLPDGRKSDLPEGRKDDLPEGRKADHPEGRKADLPEGRKTKTGSEREEKRPEKKQEKALKRKLRKKMNRKLGRASFPSSRKNKEKETIRKASPISVLFIDNTKGGVLANKLQEADTRLETMTNYKVRVVESPGTALSRLLPSRNPWGAGDWQARLCAVQPAG